MHMHGWVNIDRFKGAWVEITCIDRVLLLLLLLLLLPLLLQVSHRINL